MTLVYVRLQKKLLKDIWLKKKYTSMMVLQTEILQSIEEGRQASETICNYVDSLLLETRWPHG